MAMSLAPTPRPPTPCDPLLESALADLVSEGVITTDQARAVSDARQAAASLAVARPGDTVEPQPAPVRRNPLPEILGYVGAALVGSALLTLVGQMWDGWGAWTRVVVVATATVLAGGTGLVLAGVSGWRCGLAAGPAFRRRVVAVVLSTGSILAGLTTLVVCDALGYGEARWSPLVSGAVAFAAAAGTAWLVRAVLSTLAVAAATEWLVLGAVAAWQPPDTAWYLPLALLGCAAAWVVLAPRVLAVPPLSEALGWAFALQCLVPYAMYRGFVEEDPWLGTGADDALVQAWVARGALVALAVVGIAVFLRGGHWPWAAGGVLAAVTATLAIGAQTLNVVLALLMAGVALLLVSAFLLAARRGSDRRHAGAATGPPA